VWKFDDGPGNVLAAAPYLDAPDPALRWRAVYALARGGDPTAVPRVLGLPEDAEHRVREYIARTLTAPRADSASATDSARAWLVGALDDPHPHVRVNALRSLATYGDRAPLADMARLLGDPDANVAVAAAEGLGALGPAAATALDAALDTGQGPIPVLGAVLSALARADPGRAAPRLREWATGDARSRYFAARAAAAMPPARSLELARELARDPDTHVAVAALGAAAAIADDSAAAPDLRAGAREVLSRAARSDDPVRQAASRPESEVEPAPAAPVRDLDDYRELVRRYIAPVLSGEARPKARIATPYGPIIVELIAEEAPLTVHNFVTLAERGYFDDGVWHRVVPNFVLQDGAPGGYPSGGPGWSIRDEINRVRYARGTVGMALSGPDTGGSQWFITHSPQPHLDGGYTVFGRVLEGMDAADAVVQGDPIPTIRIER
jgi:cyclophilin family peptidyl-prolyl cis-trans isomerase/HEAT repeat protein